ncbi:hypothetical protein ON010_g2608 [Phytophthora cinnamomi]|nr:hypothetical protein ON010_g2608 [Phytophthora cinnamomi]
MRRLVSEVQDQLDRTRDAETDDLCHQRLVGQGVREERSEHFALDATREHAVRLDNASAGATAQPASLRSIGGALFLVLGVLHEAHHFDRRRGPRPMAEHVRSSAEHQVLNLAAGAQTCQVLVREKAVQRVRRHAEAVGVELVEETRHNAHYVAFDAQAVHEQLRQTQVSALQQVLHLPTQLVDVQREVELARLELLALLTTPLPGGAEAIRTLALAIGHEPRDDIRATGPGGFRGQEPTTGLRYRWRRSCYFGFLRNGVRCVVGFA